MDSDFVDI